jgi:hypothetical protein
MSIYIETYKQPGNRRRGENDDGRPQTDTGLAFYDTQRLLLLLPAEISSSGPISGRHPHTTPPSVLSRMAPNETPTAMAVCVH